MVLVGNQALDPAGLAPALVTDNKEKVTVRVEKKFARRGMPSRDISPRKAASTYSFAYLPGQIDRTSLSIRA